MEYNNTLITHPTSLEINENKPYPLFFLEFVNATSVPIATTAIPISPVCNGYSVIPVYEAIDDFDKLRPRIDEYAVVVRSVLVTIIVVHKKATYPTSTESNLQSWPMRSLRSVANGLPHPKPQPRKYSFPAYGDPKQTLQSEWHSSPTIPST